LEWWWWWWWGGVRGCVRGAGGYIRSWMHLCFSSSWCSRNEFPVSEPRPAAGANGAWNFCFCVSASLGGPPSPHSCAYPRYIVVAPSATLERIQLSKHACTPCTPHAVPNCYQHQLPASRHAWPCLPSASRDCVSSSAMTDV
jgi:hypothetical protein